MEFLGKLGIDYKLLIAQIVNFAVLLWLLTKFLYKPIIKQIEAGEQGISEAKAGQQELETEKGKNKIELAKARARAKEIVAEAEGIALKIKDNAKKEAEADKATVVKQIRARLKEIDDDQRKR